MVILTLLNPETKTPVQRWQFEQSMICVGRSPDNDVVLSDGVVSRYHLELRTAGSRSSGKGGPQPCWEVVNRSSNGTFLNGYLITQAELPPQGELRLAQTGPLLHFQLKLAAPASKSPELPPLPSSISLGRVLCDHQGSPAGSLFCIRCGQPLQILKTVRQYQVLRLLARGGMGTTYLVWSSDSHRLHPQRGHLQVLKEMNADVAHLPKAQELFEREAIALKALRHPNIPRFYDFFIDQGKKYLVMELVHGKDLEQWVRQQGTVAIPQAIAWMIQACQVLAYLHQQPQPMIHRDIKPSNLLVRQHDQQVVVLDFGAIKAAGLPPGTRIGAEGYSAPEQIQGRAVIQSDLYAIGTTLIFLLTGRSPGKLYRKQEGIYRFVLDEDLGLPLRLQQVIKCVTAPVPGDRYSSATELAHALASAVPL